MNDKIKAPRLYTDRLVLSDITEDDAPAVVEWRSDPDIYKFFVSPHKLTLEEHLDWYRNRYVYDANRFDWIAFSGETPIGIFGLKRENKSSDTAEVSYILSPKYYGKGYAGEAVKRLIVFCKEEWKCRKVIAEIHRDNDRSVRFVKRLSFVLESAEGDFVRYGKEL